MMKDDTPQGKKSQKQPGQKAADANLPSFQNEEDVDFEILDALEQLEQSEQQGQGFPNENDTIEMTLDDEDVIFGNGSSEEIDGLDFDETIGGGLDDDAFGENIGEDFQMDMGEDSFSLDFDQEEEQDELDVLLDQETDKTLKVKTGEFSTNEFLLDSTAEDEVDFSASEMPEQSEDEEFDLGISEERFSTDSWTTDEETSFDQPGFDLESDDTAFDLGTETQEATLDLGAIEEESELDFESKEVGFDLGEDLEEHIDNLAPGIDSPGDFEEDEESAYTDIGGELEDDSDFNIDLDEEEESDFPEMDFEEEDDEFQGKPLISIDDDQVIDLGDEEDIEQDDGFEIEQESGLEEEESQMPETPQEESDEKLPDVEDDRSSAFDEDNPELELDQEEDEDFMTSLEDMEIDLEEEAKKALEVQSNVAGDSLAESEDADIGLDGELDLTVDEDLESEEIDMDDFAEEDQEVGQDLDSASEMMSEVDEGVGKEAEASPEPAEPDEREFLELTLRLSDAQMQDFEGMIAESRTLQGYLDELEKHKSEVKDTIYHKLQIEYIARKTVIFKSGEFKTLHADVEQDLLDMLAKQKDFVETVERLNEELEEITVRHMVGEYSDQLLSEREKAQKSEIAQWNEKAEKIAQLIARYQESLEAEQALNPLHKEQEELAEETEDEKETGVVETETLPEEQDADEFAEETLPEEQTAEEIAEEIEEEPSPVQPETTADSEQEPVIPSEELEEEMFGQDEISEDFPEAQQELEDIGEEDGDEGLFGVDIEINTDFGDEEFEIDDSLGLAEEENEELSVAYEVEAFGEEEAEQQAEENISCKKCGRQTPASEKFCIHCGAKAR